MVIVKVLNNSSAVVNDDGVEKIILGKGCVFGKKAGDQINATGIEKMFVIESEAERNRLIELVEQIPVHCIEIVEEIVEYAQGVLNQKLNDSIYLALADHISFILERYKKGIFPTNALKYDIRRYYEKEYKLSEKAVSLIEDEYDIELNDDEVASIAMHIVNAEYDLSMQDGVKVIEIVDKIVQIIRYYLQIDIDINGSHYHRLLIHLRFFVWRVIKNEQNQKDNSLYAILKINYPKAYKCVLRIVQFIEDTYHFKVSEDECTYLIVHIQRVLED